MSVNSSLSFFFFFFFILWLAIWDFCIHNAYIYVHQVHKYHSLTILAP